MANVTLVFYDEDGKITSFQNGPEEAFQDIPGTYLATTDYEVALDSTHWVDDDVLTPRVSLDTVATLTGAANWVPDGVDTISYGPGLPNPTLVHIRCDNPMFDEVVTTITDDTLTLTTTAPGHYIIELTGFPYLKKTIELDTV